MSVLDLMAPPAMSKTIPIFQAALPEARKERGAENWARGAIAYSRLACFVQPAIVNGTVGLVLASRGRLSRALDFKIAKGKIVQVDIIAAPERLQQIDLAVLETAKCQTLPVIIIRRKGVAKRLPIHHLGNTRHFRVES